MCLERNAINEKEIVARKTIHDDFKKFFWRYSKTPKTLLKNYQ